MEIIFGGYIYCMYLSMYTMFIYTDNIITSLLDELELFVVLLTGAVLTWWCFIIDMSL